MDFIRFSTELSLTSIFSVQFLLLINHLNVHTEVAITSNDKGKKVEKSQTIRSEIGLITSMSWDLDQSHFLQVIATFVRLCVFV